MSQDQLPVDPASPVPTRLLESRTFLKGNGEYLANPGVVDRVKWSREGRAQKLVECGVPNEDGDEPGTPDTLPKLAILTLVGNVSDSDFFLTADAGFRGNSEYDTIFAKAKATASVEAPTAAEFAADFPVALGALQAICNKVYTKGHTIKKGLLVGLDDSRVKIRHALFEPKTQDDCDDEETTAADKDLNAGLDEIDVQKGNTADIMTIENWPVRTDAAIAAIKSMIGSHYVVPIPAYDMHGELIHPDFYRRRLEGALVAVRFTMTHWSISRSSTDVYTADIESIRVLAPPKPTLVTPRKRGRVPAFDPMSPLPLEKKRRYLFK